MDLRVKKTEKAIRGAFYQLLRERPIEKITVRDLSEIAEINKTTFYAHYDTIYDLIDTLEQETIESIIEHLDDCELLFNEPEIFVRNMYNSMKLYPDIKHALSSPSSQQFTEKLNRAIRKELQEQNVDMDQYRNLGALVSFIINGVIGLQKNQSSNDANHEIEYIGRFVEGGINALGLSKRRCDSSKKS